jgi:hypothetical protein
MDPITIGTAIGTTVVAPLAKELIQKAAQPETVAKGINWVFSAADHFLKLRRGQTSPDEPAPALPDAGEVVEGEIVEEAKVPSSPRVKPDIDEFTLNLLASQVESLMKQIEIYVGNLQHLSQQAGQYGGEELAPLHVVNQIKLQRKSIVERLNELADLMNQIYDVQVEGVGKLAEALDAA